MTNTLQILMKKFLEEKVPYPRTLNLELTTRCNLRCIMCPKTLGKTESIPDGDIDENVYNVVERDVLPHVRQLVLSFVGEPLLQKKYLFRLLENCFNRRIAVSLVTNGLLLDHDTAELLVEKKVLELNVSVDASDENIYRQIRGGNFQTVVNNLITLKELKLHKNVAEPYLKLSFVAMKRNISGLEHFVELAASVGAREVVVQSLHVHEGIEDQEIKISQKKGDLIYFNKAQESARKLNINISFSPDLVLTHPEFHVFKPDYEDFICRLPWTTIYVDRFGNVRPCCGLPPLGNLVGKSFDEIWFGESFQNFRRKLVLEDSGFCPGCSEGSAKSPLKISHSLNLRAPHQLGNGWYHCETENQQDYRWTSDKASFYIKPNGSKIFLMEYRGFKKEGILPFSRLCLGEKTLGILDHSNEIVEMNFDIQNEEILRFDLETSKPEIPWCTDLNYPDPRLLGLKVSFAGFVQPYNFFNQVNIIHVELPNFTIQSDNQYPVRIYWKKTGKTDENLFIFLHFVHESVMKFKRFIPFLSRNYSWFRQRFFQFDHILEANGEENNHTIKNVFNFKVPENQKKGSYNVFIGCWYPYSSRQRLKTVDKNSTNYVPISSIELV